MRFEVQILVAVERCRSVVELSQSAFRELSLLAGKLHDLAQDFSVLSFGEV